MARILIVEDEKIACNSLGQYLVRKGYTPSYAYTLFEGRRAVDSDSFDIYLIDIRLPDGNGLELIPLIRGRSSAAIIVILTAYATIEGAITALKSGADHYLIKPVDLDELLMVLEREGERKSIQAENVALKAYVSSLSGFGNIVGQSVAMTPVIERLKKLCDSDSSVLITGESGTGKELAARVLHYSGRRQGQRFVVVNCAAIPEHLLESELFGHVKGAFTGAMRDHQGKFEYANGGTIFLDEIGELNQRLQAKLLRVLQEKTFAKLGSNSEITVDVRIMASTNRDLKEMVAAGRFRDDLYWRLNVVEVHLPPLKERAEDIELLARYFAEKTARKLGKQAPDLSPEVLKIFSDYNWPGNIRELENIVERCMALSESPVIGTDLLPTRLRNIEKNASEEDGSGDGYLRSVLQEAEKNAIRKILLQENGNRVKTAKSLGVSLRTLQYKLKLYNIG